MTSTIAIDAAAMRALEEHETAAHAIPSREVRDQGDALMLYDARDPDPFWNRMARVRWPSDPAAFDRRLTEAMAQFLVLGRRPHVWPAPVHAEPADLAERLVSNGFRDVGGGHLMVLVDPGSCGPVGPGDAGPEVTLEAVRHASDAADPNEIAGVLVESFGVSPARIPDLAEDLRITLDDPRVVLAIARVDGEPAAVAKVTAFDGHAYISSVGTRPSFRGMGLAGLVTRHVLAAAGTHGAHTAYLGVFGGNRPALRVYERLGFASIGESPDLLFDDG